MKVNQDFFALVALDLNFPPNRAGMVLAPQEGVAMPKAQSINCVEHLHQLNKSQVLELWRNLFKNEPTVEMRSDLMLRMVAQRLQEQQFGGVPHAAGGSLRRFAKTIAANPNAAAAIKSSIKSGTRMVRQWKDQVHVVNVEGKRFAYRGAKYESLSQIARLITGTRWSGPLFFGVKRSQSVEAQ